MTCFEGLYGINISASILMLNLAGFLLFSTLVQCSWIESGSAGVVLMCSSLILTTYFRCFCLEGLTFATNLLEHAACDSLVKNPFLEPSFVKVWSISIFGFCHFCYWRLLVLTLKLGSSYWNITFGILCFSSLISLTGAPSINLENVGLTEFFPLLLIVVESTIPAVWNFPLGIDLVSCLFPNRICL